MTSNNPAVETGACIRQDRLPEPPAVVDEESAAAYRARHHKGKSDPAVWSETTVFMDRVAMHFFERGWLVKVAAEAGAGASTFADALESFRTEFRRGMPDPSQWSEDAKMSDRFGSVMFEEGWNACANVKAALADC
ncbi:hypothetical protein [Burkholderia cenocepacia]|uniref:hypothetical protein n=1 Tax=Burkholderia cenocepacia TaxID=95486 RepID=UPI000761C82A|nr:hypothetical protein [Burkholderia cenocepacia]KWU19042.1 hypothetical protein AS149_12405 [Burkholderia cenocepacia]